MTEIITHTISVILLTLPKLAPVVSDIAFTKASPEFIIASAIIAKEIPKANIKIPINNNINFIK